MVLSFSKTISKSRGGGEKHIRHFVPILNGLGFIVPFYKNKGMHGNLM